jgi:glycosyltransferase involved in cell wall biosynthesis
MLSVIVPNFNHGHVLPEAIGALLAQERPPDEIIVIDDGSTDDSRSVIEALAADEPRIRPLPNERNCGAIASLNRGIAAARGEFVAFAAADDITHRSLFATALAALSRHREAALFCAEALVLGDAAGRSGRKSVRPIIRPSARERSFTPAEARHLLARSDHFIVTLTAVFRRSTILAAGGLDPGLGSMADAFLARQLALTHGFCFAPKTLATWRVSHAGLSRTTSRDPEVVLDLLEAARARIADSPIYPPGYERLFERRWRFAACRHALIAEPPQWSCVARVGARSPFDRAAIAAISALPSAWGRVLALAMLAVRLRPLSLVALALTAVQRGLRAQPSANVHPTAVAASGGLTASSSIVPGSFSRFCRLPRRLTSSCKGSAIAGSRFDPSLRRWAQWLRWRE